MKIPKEMDEKTFNEFLNLLSTVSEFVVAHPDSNQPEVIENYQEVTRDIDAFLLTCKTGEVDPKGLIRKKEEDDDGPPWTIQ